MKLLDNCISNFTFDPDPQIIKDLETALIYKAEGKSPDSIKNTYLKDLPIPQIVLFDILANKFPLVTTAQKIVQQVVLAKTQDKENITIIDIGLGRGIQMAKLIKAVKEQKSIKHLTLIGVEIFQPALEASISYIENIKNELPFTLTFFPVLSSVEELSIELIQQYLPKQCDFLFINASLTLHHIQKDEDRIAFFKKIAPIQADLLSIIEPNADVFTDNFEERLKNVYEHFNTLYTLIHSLPLTDDEKSGLKQFFSVELFDAIALPDKFRFEKYSPASKWIEQGKQTGLHPQLSSGFIEHLVVPEIEIKLEEAGYVNLSFNHINLLSTLIFEK